MFEKPELDIRYSELTAQMKQKFLNRGLIRPAPMQGLLPKGNIGKKLIAFN